MEECKYKEYRYKGYTFRKTATLTEYTFPKPGYIHGHTLRNLYEIDGLKERGRLPFLTSIEQCKEYIRHYGREQ